MIDLLLIWTVMLGIYTLMGVVTSLLTEGRQRNERQLRYTRKHI